MVVIAVFHRARGGGLGSLRREGDRLGDNPISRPEIAFAASAIAPAATMPVTPRRTVMTRSLVVMGSP